MVLMKGIMDFVELCKVRFSAFEFIDVVDIILLGILFFITYRFIRRRRALPILIGVVVYLLFMQLCGVLGINTTYNILKWLSVPGTVVLFIIFQSDIRSALEKIGVSIISVGKAIKNKVIPRPGSMEAEAIERAVMRLSATKTGALIVLEQNTGIEDIGQDGIKIDAVISPELICNLFFSPAPLHDGAIIIRKKRISAAGCFLPNYSDPALNSSFGSRHRAAIGMSRNSDAGVIVISEEDGRISYAYGGELSRGIDEQTLRSVLEEYYGVAKKKKSK
ncbi:MAG: diadenylate cyclase [Clostridia bacterium]|nr:diadenylate cyclase [Clostridia bacterium]